MNISQSLKELIEMSEQSTRDRNHSNLTIEQVMATIIEHDPTSQNMLNSFHIDDTLVLKDLKEHLERCNNNKGEYIGSTGLIERSTEFSKFMARAIFIAQSKNTRKDGSVEPIFLFFALFDANEETIAKEILRSHGFSRAKLRKYVAENLEMPDDNNSRPDEPNNEGAEGSQEFMLKDFTTDLTELARRGELDPLIGREIEVARTVHILSRRRKNNPILVGDAGVGKTSIAEGLAQAISDGQVPEDLKSFKVLSLDINSLIAGTKYRGDFEKRLKTVLDKTSKQNIILFIDEAHTILGAGNSSGGSLDMSNTLKPYLASGKVTCLAATTTEEYRQIFEKNSALSRRFNKVSVPPLSEEETFHVINGLKSKFESHHKVVYSKEAIWEAIKLAERHIHDRRLPDKAVDIIDEAGALVKLDNLRTDKTVLISDVENVVSEITRKPVRSANSEQEIDKLVNLSSEIKQFVFGQEDAVEKLVDSIILSRAGIKNPHQPIGSFLFLGPTGVGKTEVAKQLSKALDMNLIRLDMSEYMEKHTASKMIGSPPGYIGYEKGGELTEAINDNPHSILLLDEMEKAHPDVFNLFLQVLDYGQLTDSTGRTVDFKNTLIIMTSNCGVIRDNQNKNGMGFFANKEARSKIDQTIVNQTFSPEFQNRIDNILEFNSLNSDMMLNIVRKGITELQHFMDNKNVTLHLEKDVLEWIAENGYDPDMGARPVNKLIKHKLAQPIAKIMLFNGLHKGGEIYASIKEGEIEISFKSPQEEIEIETA